MDERLLIVEDDPDILDVLTTGLRLAGFAIATATSGTAALDAMRQSEHDLIVLDVMLPDLDGFEVVRRLRKAGRNTPVLYLTARDNPSDKIEGLSIGGDDYVTKPFNLGEVRARIRAVLRRTADRTPRAPRMLTFADIEANSDSGEVWRAGQPIALSPTEFKLLCYFLRHPDRVLPKPEILRQVWDYDFTDNVGIVESYVSTLRRKIDNRHPRLLHTRRGVGYVLRETPES